MVVNSVSRDVGGVVKQWRKCLDSGVTNAVSIDERLGTAFSEVSADTQNEYAAIMGKLTDPRALSSPGGLFGLQVQLGEYKQKVETISAVTRKCVSTVETLLRA